MPQIPTLTVTKRNDPRLLDRMAVHYSQPKGFVGRNICYAITHDDRYFGHIVGGSATRFLPGRNEALHIGLTELNTVVNNVFFNISPGPSGYPFRNFVRATLAAWRVRVARDWADKYGDIVVGFETLVQIPRTGECYRRDGWTQTGVTKGFTCKRVAGSGSDSWTGARKWNTDPEHLRPKIVLVRPRTETEMRVGACAFR